MKKAYGIYFIGYLVLSIIKLLYYFSYESNLFGLIYFIMSALILFVLILTFLNYNSFNRKIRISKNTILIVLMIFISYVLPKLNFIDGSDTFINNMYVFLYFIDSFFIVSLVIITVLELGFKNKSK